MLVTYPMPPWVRKRKVVNASSTLLTDVILKPTFTSLRYKLSIFNEIENKYFTCNLDVVKTPTGFSDALTNKINETGLDVEINSLQDASNYQLSITNNENFDLTISYAKLTLKN